MLNKDHITRLTAGTPEWNEYRLGKITSSNIHLICGKKGIGESGLSYIYEKVGESITGRSDQKQYGFVEQLDYGLDNEVAAVRELCQQKGWDWVVLQKTISNGGLFASTPDGLFVEHDAGEKGYVVKTIEVKCPFKFQSYIRQRMCATPEQLKGAFPEYYWQVIDQMLVCGATEGIFYTYHPDFPEGNRGHEILFKKVPLWDDFTFLKERKGEAAEMFSLTKHKLLHP